MADAPDDLVAAGNELLEGAIQAEMQQIGADAAVVPVGEPDDFDPTVEVDLSAAAKRKIDQIGRAVDNHANKAAPKLPQPWNDYHALGLMDEAGLDAHEIRIGPPAMQRLIEKVGAKNKQDIPRAVL